MAFVGLHESGLDCCMSNAERGWLAWLCHKGNAVGWGAPFPAKDRDLAVLWECGRGSVRPFLLRMEAAGVVQIVEKGDRRTPRLIAVLTPFPAKRPGQNSGQNSSQNSQGATGVLVEPRAKPKPKLQPQDVASGSGVIGREDQDQDLDKDVQALWDANREHHPARRKRPGASDAKYLRARIRESGLDACLLVTDFIHDPNSWWAKNGRTAISTIFKADKWSARLEQAEQWRSGFRPPSDTQQADQDPEVDRIWRTVFAYRDNPSLLKHELNGAFDRVAAALRACSWPWAEFRQKRDPKFIKAEWRAEFGRHYRATQEAP